MIIGHLYSFIHIKNNQLLFPSKGWSVYLLSMLMQRTFNNSVPSSIKLSEVIIMLIGITELHLTL